jgi:hypothetical protein
MRPSAHEFGKVLPVFAARQHLSLAFARDARGSSVNGLEGDPHAFAPQLY